MPRICNSSILALRNDLNFQPLTTASDDIREAAQAIVSKRANAGEFARGVARARASDRPLALGRVAMSFEFAGTNLEEENIAVPTSTDVVAQLSNSLGLVPVQ